MPNFQSDTRLAAGRGRRCGERDSTAPSIHAAPAPARREAVLGLALSVVVFALVSALTGCEGDPGTGPVAVKWDRVACERCRMVLSARHHSAQVRVREAGGRSKVYFFDDIGCAVIWLEDKPVRDDSGTEIWVNDWRTGEWIDARSAHYLTGQETPMQYGLGAQSDPAPGALDYAGAKAHIDDVERRFNIHGGALDVVPAGHEHE